MDAKLEITEDQRAVCGCCGRWVHLSDLKLIKHSTRCATPEVQPVFESKTIEPSEDQVSKQSQRKRYKGGSFSKDSPGSGLSDDDLLMAVYMGEVSIDDAMNLDF